jgi:hypothetical protein
VPTFGYWRNYWLVVEDVIVYGGKYSEWWRMSMVGWKDNEIDGGGLSVGARKCNRSLVRRTVGKSGGYKGWW